MRLLLLLSIVWTLSGCSPESAEVKELEMLLEERKQSLKRVRENLDTQPQREKRVQALQSELEGLLVSLELEQMLLEEPELLPQHVEAEVMELAGGLKVELERSEYVDEKDDYPLQRVTLKVDGEKEQVLRFLEDIARCRPGRFCRVVDLELQRGADRWSGRVRADFFLRGGRKRVE